MHLFLCFQMIQAPKITMELKDFLACPVTAKLLLLHQLLKERTPCCGPRFCNPLNLRSSDQNCLAKTQSTSRWLIVSGAWSHNRHKSGWARALFASLSAVQHLSWWTSQIKNLHCSGDPTCPYLIRWLKAHITLKHGSVCRFGRIYTRST
jgi:hypothetical protein